MAPSRGGAGDGVREGAAPGTGAFARSAKQEAGGPGGSFAGGWSWPYRGLKNLRKDMVKREGAVLPVGMGNFLDRGGNIFINSLDKFIKIIYNRGAVRGWDISPGC